MIEGDLTEIGGGEGGGVGIVSAFPRGRKRSYIDLSS